VHNESDVMFAYVALLVGYDLQTSEVIYGAVEVIVDRAELPENTAKNIRTIVNYANSLENRDDHIEYIDMYGYSYMGAKTFWEVAGTEEEFGELHYE
tara:strand:+ start:3960 stop:4250 length:291 start_codon:yes stop_codon:yes gene_type:complete